jgi:signal transduction histidine kinase
MTEIVRRCSGGSSRSQRALRRPRVEESGAAEAYADPARIRQVVDNLMANAVKFNRDGGRVTASTSTDGVHTTVRVADTGIGMAPMRPRECSSGSSERAVRAGQRFGVDDHT